MGESEDDCVYVFLEFNENLTPSIFTENVFLRVANLHKPNPLLQINNLVFKGSYDESVGTNLFFEEVEDPPPKTNIYERETPIRLKPVISQTKLIKLKQIKLPRKILCSKEVKEAVHLNLNQDYQILLDKLEQGVLNIADVEYREQEPDEETYEDINFDTNQEKQTETEPALDNYAALLGNKSPSSLLEAKYEKLKNLARRPVKRIPSPQRIVECDPKYKNAYEYHNLEKQFLQSSDAFRSNSNPIIDKSYIGGVDIDRCVLKGILPHLDETKRTLTPEQQNKVFAMENLDNLSIPARYLVVKKCLTEIETLIANTTTEELNETDENSRTVNDFYDIFKRLALALEHHMGQTSQENIKILKKSMPANSNEEFISYKYNKRDNLVRDIETFNEDNWTDNEDENPKQENSSEKHGDSDNMSVDDDNLEQLEDEDME